MGNQSVKDCRLVIVTSDDHVHNIEVTADLIRSCEYFMFNPTKNIYPYIGRIDVSHDDVIHFIALVENYDEASHLNYNRRNVYTIAKKLKADILSDLRIDCLITGSEQLVKFVDESDVDMCKAVDKMLRNKVEQYPLFHYPYKNRDMVIRYLTISDMLNPYVRHVSLTLFNEIDTLKAQNTQIVNLIKKYQSCQHRAKIILPYCAVVEQGDERYFLFDDISKLRTLESMNMIEILMNATDIEPL